MIETQTNRLALAYMMMMAADAMIDVVTEHRVVSRPTWDWIGLYMRAVYYSYQRC